MSHKKASKGVLKVASVSKGATFMFFLKLGDVG